MSICQLFIFNQRRQLYTKYVYTKFSPGIYDDFIYNQNNLFTFRYAQIITITSRERKENSIDIDKGSDPKLNTK